MITEEYIRELTNTTVFQRGKSIQRSDWKIEEFSVSEAGDKDYISAQVAGSRGNHYYVTGEYDYTHHEVYEMTCECPAYYSYDGLCKHCIAVLLEYMEYCERRKVIKDYLGNNSRNKMNAKIRSRSTTQEIKQLLDVHMRRKTAPVVQKGVHGQVVLEPHLELNQDEIDLTFKIGVSQMYILKDISGFLENLDESREYSYGKKLSFIHTEDAFTEESRNLVRFIKEWMNNNKNGRSYSTYRYVYGYYSTQEIRKTIQLKGEDLDDFFDAIGEMPFYLKENQRVEKIWHLEDKKNYSPKLEIQGKDNGIEIKIQPIVHYESSRNDIYFLQGNVFRVEKTKQNDIQQFIKCIEGRMAFIQKEDIPLFCRDFLPELREKYDCREKEFEEEDFVIAEAKYEIYLDMPQKDFITCRLMAVYGDKKYNVRDKNTEKNARDLYFETEIEEKVAVWFNALNENEKLWVLAEDEEAMYDLLMNGIVQLQSIGEVYISDALKKITIRSTPKIEVGISIEGNLLDLKMSVEDIPKKDLVEILSRYQKKKKYYRLKNGDFVDIDDDKIAVISEIQRGLGIKDSELQEENIYLPKYRALYLDTQLKENQSIPVIKNREFKSLLRNMKTIEDNDFEIPEKMESLLREYQKRGFLWLKTLKENGFGGILADDMGLGKTLQVITFLLSEQIENEKKENNEISSGLCRSLIVAPASLVLNWKSEIDHFASELPVRIIIGNAEERKKMIQQAGENEILVTSYDLLKRDISAYSGLRFANQIIDEAQFIKNYGTQAAKTVRKIQADFKLALTGTPVENRLSELWSIFEYIMPGFLYTYQKFRKEIEQQVVIEPDGEAAKRLKKMVHPFILRRLKKDVLTDLPDKIEKNTYINLEEEQQRLYDAHVKRLQLLLDKQTEEEFKTSKIVILSEITKLRQICCCPALIYEDYPYFSAKENLCVDLIHKAAEAGHKILLFSQFTSMLDRLEERFQQEKISFYKLTGSTSKEKRLQMVEQFNKDDTTVFCISLKAGGTGLNLTAADIVIHYDPWWNLAVQNQATDRAHRIGQENVVTVYKLIAKETIEENIVKLQEKKMALADQIIGGEEMGSGSFSKEELLELLKEL